MHQFFDDVCALLRARGCRFRESSIGASSVVLLLLGCATTTVQARQDCGITIDGQFEEAEWGSADRFAVAPGVTMLILRAGQELCLGFGTAAAGPRYIDLFIAAAGSILNLHASMKLGERALPLEHWSDQHPPWVWENNLDWTANRVTYRPGAVDTGDFAQRVKPYEGFEFVIQRSRLPAGARMRVEVRDFEGRRADIVWPHASTRGDWQSWVPLDEVSRR